MARLDILTPLHQFIQRTGRDPTDTELKYIRHAVVIVPIAADLEDYMAYWEGEVVMVPFQAKETGD